MRSLLRSWLAPVCAVVCFGLMSPAFAQKGAAAHPLHPLLPKKARPNGIVTERELAAILKRLERQTAEQNSAMMAGKKPSAPVTRLRAVVELVKRTVPASVITSYSSDLEQEEMPPDAAQIPARERPYVAAAVGEGWLRVDCPLRPRQMLTWMYLDGLLTRMALEEEKLDIPEPPEGESKDAPANVETAVYTGLILEVGALKVSRAMSPRILDEEGNVLYPDPKHLPNFDYVQDNGMAAYCKTAEEAKRAGDRPLIVSALRLYEKNADDFVVSKEVAERIREANQKGRFLRRWAVCILSSPPAESK